MKKESKSRLDRSYENYVKRYEAKQEMMRRHGYEMASKMIKSKEMYAAVIEAMKEEGRKINLNQTLVADQAYKYSLKTAQRFKATAEKYDLSWKDMNIRQLRTGGVDVSEINDLLKEQNPEWTGKQRQQYISYEVFGSD